MSETNDVDAVVMPDDEILVIGVYEVYSTGRSNCLLFLTEQEAKDQHMIAPSDGPYPANVRMTSKEYAALRESRYMWA